MAGAAHEEFLENLDLLELEKEHHIDKDQRSPHNTPRCDPADETMRLEGTAW